MSKPVVSLRVACPLPVYERLSSYRHEARHETRSQAALALIAAGLVALARPATFIRSVPDNFEPVDLLASPPGYLRHHGRPRNGRPQVFRWLIRLGLVWLGQRLAREYLETPQQPKRSVPRKPRRGLGDDSNLLAFLSSSANTVAIILELFRRDVRLAPAATSWSASSLAETGPFLASSRLSYDHCSAKRAARGLMAA